MTCIVGLVDAAQAEPTLFMGADSAGVAGLDLMLRADEKLFVNGPFVMGFTTSFRMGQVLRYSLSPASFPAPPAPGDDLDRYMATTFIDAVRGALKSAGWATRDKEHEEGGSFLVGVHARLYRIESDYQIGRTRRGYDAVGGGAAYALGALYASERPAIDRVLSALGAAEAHSASVRAPFHILHVSATGVVLTTAELP